MHVRTAIVCCLLAAASRSQQPGPTQLISGQPGGFLDTTDITVPRVTADGRFVFFTVLSQNMIYVHDVGQGTTTPVISGAVYAVTPDGRFVATETIAPLLPEDHNQSEDVYVLDRQAGTLTLASVALDGSAGNTGSFGPSLCSDGHLVAFESDASDLVPGDNNQGFFIGRDIFVRDLAAGTTQRVSLAWDGSECVGNCQSAWLSGDGHVVAFQSDAGNLVPVDTNGVFPVDIFVRDLGTDVLSLESVDSQGLQDKGNSGLPSLSEDGRFVAFQSVAKLAPGDMNGQTPAKGSDVFVRDRLTGVTTRISSNPGGLSLTGNSMLARISGDGRWVSFESLATDLVPGDTNGVQDAFLFDRLTGQMQRVSVSSSGVQNNGPDLANTTLSATGRFVAFQCGAIGLAPGDNDGFIDVYLHDRGPWVDLGGAKTGASGTPLLTGNGSLIAGEKGSVVLSQVAATAQASLLVSFAPAPIPFQGGVLQAWPAAAVFAIQAGVLGSTAIPFVFPAGVLSQTHFVMQAIVYPLGPTGAMALSNAVEATTL